MNKKKIIWVMLGIAAIVITVVLVKRTQYQKKVKDNIEKTLLTHQFENINDASCAWYKSYDNTTLTFQDDGTVIEKREIVLEYTKKGIEELHMSEKDNRYSESEITEKYHVEVPLFGKPKVYLNNVDYDAIMSGSSIRGFETSYGGSSWAYYIKY